MEEKQTCILLYSLENTVRKREEEENQEKKDQEYASSV